MVKNCDDKRIEPLEGQEAEKLRHELTQSEAEKKRLENILADLENRLNTIMQSVSDIVYILDEEGRITFINDGVERMGFSPRELVGVNIFDIVHPDDRERARYRLNERRRGERSTRALEVHVVTKNGNRHKDSGGEGNIPRTPVLTVSAEGQYRYTEDNSLSFVGTIGIAASRRSGKSSGETSGDDSSMILNIRETTPFIPVCANCKNIRNEKGEWERLESYFSRKLGMRFTHTICPVCTSTLYPDLNNNSNSNNSSKS